MLISASGQLLPRIVFPLAGFLRPRPVGAGSRPSRFPHVLCCGIVRAYAAELRHSSPQCHHFELLWMAPRGFTIPVASHFHFPISEFFISLSLSPSLGDYPPCTFPFEVSLFRLRKFLRDKK
jgi:hypothetical protein